ncbi:MAG: hypothetical protein ABJ275_02800 [Maricaulaceae bacterium]
MLGLVSCDSTEHYVKAEAPEIVRWSLPTANIVDVLSIEPNECLPEIPTDSQVLGRLAFRSPFLLGGQAARRGLTCQACHGQGQVNENFFVVGLSETPGTADVTSFHFSDVLGDESFNPVPIPSLSDDVEAVDFDPDKTDLEKFVLRLITKEFTGPEPTPEVQAALMSYLRGVSDEHCTASHIEHEALLAHQLKSVRQSYGALIGSNLNVESFDFMVAALRVELGRLHNRFPNHSGLQEKLSTMSQSLRGVNMETGDIKALYSEWPELEADLMAAYPRSLYQPQIIQEWANARREASTL